MRIYFIKGLFLYFLIFFINFCLYSQTCPTYSQRNNGNGGGNSDCGSEVGLPSGYSKTGSFQFTGVAVNMSVLKVEQWNGSAWVTYQNNSSTPATYGTFWYGGYNGANGKVCFYANGGGNGVPPAANWKFYFTPSGGTQYSCTYNIDANGVLPVTWETVSAQKQNSQVLINWSTASEQNTKDFEVQYSTNTTNWDLLGTLRAAGNSNSTRNYSFTHQTPLKNNTYNYYRILQRDLDGKFSYSKIVSIVFDEPGPDFLVYPNPADKLATIYLSEASEVSLINSAGSVVWKSKLPAGRNQLPLEKFSSGVYIIRAGKSSQRLIIQ